jgi:uncharacterized protein (DUF2249 family)
MKQIELTRGFKALIDDEDFERVSEHKWQYIEPGYATRSLPKKKGKRGSIKMHRFILNAPKDMEVDHINFDGLDNRKGNLRLASHAQNGQHTRRRNLKSGYFGVRYYRRGPHHWRVSIKHAAGYVHVGYFDDPMEAAKAYDRVAKALHGDFAKLNNV